MAFIEIAREKFGMRLKKKIGILESEFAHTTSEVTAWKASANR